MCGNILEGLSACIEPIKHVITQKILKKIVIQIQIQMILFSM